MSKKKRKEKRREEKAAKKEYLRCLEEQRVAQSMLDEAYRATQAAYTRWVAT